MPGLIRQTAPAGRSGALLAENSPPVALPRGGQLSIGLMR